MAMDKCQMFLDRMRTPVRAVVGSKVSSSGTGKSPDIQISTPQPPPPQQPS